MPLTTWSCRPDFDFKEV